MKCLSPVDPLTGIFHKYTKLMHFPLLITSSAAAASTSVFF